MKQSNKKEKEECPDCQGSGVITEYIQTYMTYEKVTTPCKCKDKKHKGKDK